MTCSAFRAFRNAARPGDPVDEKEGTQLTEALRVVNIPVQLLRYSAREAQMKKCIQLFGLLIVSIAGSSDGAGVCYITGGTEYKNCSCTILNSGTSSPCPTGWQLAGTITGCKSRSSLVLVPIGTIGNQDAGFMSQGNGTFECARQVDCKKTLLFGAPPLVPPITQVSCVQQASVTCTSGGGTTTSFGPIGGVCPQPGG